MQKKVTTLIYIIQLIVIFLDEQGKGSEPGQRIVLDDDAQWETITDEVMPEDGKNYGRQTDGRKIIWFIPIHRKQGYAW